MSMSVPPFAVPAGEGTTLPTPTGSSVTIKAGTSSTSGSMTVLEILSTPMDGPAAHVHHREDELWWVLEGDYRFKLGDTIITLSRGGMAFGPRGIPHAFQNLGATPGRLLVITAPSGLERFFEMSAELASGPLDPAQLAAVGSAAGIDFVGPPLAVSDPLG
ncbi:cupin domain-containing protein [Pseudonocardia sp. TRM90224]|uniref:cupin domain-containing protein n=1 Tax=Pseudonocardia sp. TRM90224 TaxID=2812678 RepID=UPI001E633419|nr:cupin domain-containing protein [Pseudonocardia sp. TRM90224]